MLGLIMLAGLFVSNIMNNNLRSEVNLTDITADKDQEITIFLLNQPSLSWKTVSNSKNFCVFKNLDATNIHFPVSLWVQCGEFTVKDNKLEQHSGSSGPVLVDYSLEKGYIMQTPKDGSLYAPDIRTIFPKKVQEKIFNQDATLNGNRLKALAEKELLLQ